MLTATYTGAASQWTQAIDAALLAWSPFVAGDAHFQIEVKVGNVAGYLATHTGMGGVSAGHLANGTKVFVPSSLAKLQGVGYSASDFLITFNPNYSWAAGAAEPGNYHLASVALHEIGHALGVSAISNVTQKPFQIDNHLHLADAYHLADRSALMYPSIAAGEVNTITPADVAAISAGGAPTALDDTIYVVGPRVDGGAGHDTAVWLGSFNSFTADLANIETLSLRGADPLTTHQADVYRLYDAAFNRDPDLAGFTWWAGSGLDANAIAANFTASVEFAGLYNGDRESIVTALYRNVLDREPDAGGLAYWVGSSHDSAAMLVGFALAPENALGAISFTLA